MGSLKSANGGIIGDNDKVMNRYMEGVLREVLRCRPAGEGR